MSPFVTLLARDIRLAARSGGGAALALSFFALVATLVPLGVGADLNLLVLFETVLEERNVGRAAARLNLSASAISHGLGRLRQLLNDPLFLRTPKGVVPTARGMELADRAPCARPQLCRPPGNSSRSGPVASAAGVCHRRG